jgi:hypothetical protein
MLCRNTAGLKERKSKPRDLSVNTTSKIKDSKKKQLYCLDDPGPPGAELDTYSLHHLGDQLQAHLCRPSGRPLRRLHMRQGNAATPQSKHLLAHRGRLPSTALFVWLISHQPTVFFSQNKPAISNQPTILFSQNKTAPAISH